MREIFGLLAIFMCACGIVLMDSLDLDVHTVLEAARNAILGFMSFTGGVVIMSLVIYYH